MSRGAGRGSVTIDNELTMSGSVTATISGTPTITGSVGYINTDGIASGWKTANGKPRVSTTDYMIDIIKGNVPGHSSFRLIGFNNTVGTSYETVWAFSSLYTFPTSAGQIEVVSDSAEDSSGGTGVRTVDIMYLDSQFVQHIVTVTLNGITPVSTGALHSDIYRFQFAYVVTTGTALTSVGNITFRYVVGGKVEAYIIAGNTITKRAIYTIPSGYTGYIKQFSLAAAGLKYVTFTARSNRYPNGTLDGNIMFPFYETTLLNSNLIEDLSIPNKFPARTDIKIDVKAEAAGSVCSAMFIGWIEAS